MLGVLLKDPVRNKESNKITQYANTITFFLQKNIQINTLKHSFTCVRCVTERSCEKQVVQSYTVGQDIFADMIFSKYHVREYNFNDLFTKTV